MRRKLLDYPKGIIRKWKRHKISRHNHFVEEKYRGQDIYFVERPNMQECGIASILRNVLGYADYAEQKGWKLVVDYKNLKNPYLSEKEIGKINAWEYFFEQPFGVSLEEVEDKENVIQTEEVYGGAGPTDSMEFFTNANAVAYWKAAYHKYIRLSPEASEFINRQRSEIFGNYSGKILGCVARGTDYIQGKPWNHPIQPLPEDLLEVAKNVMKENEYDKIFLATEDENILNMFIANLGDKVLYVKQQRYKDGQIPIAFQDGFASATSRKTEGLLYLAAIYLLADCNALIGGRCGITTIAYLISNGFEYEYLWNFGRYHIDDYCLPARYL